MFVLYFRTFLDIETREPESTPPLKEKTFFTSDLSLSFTELVNIFLIFLISFLKFTFFIFLLFAFSFQYFFLIMRRSLEIIKFSPGSIAVKF